MSTISQVIVTNTVLKEQNKLFNFIRKRVKSSLDTEDILQDVFFQLAKISQEIESIEKLSAWLFQIARNRITDLYRKKSSLNFSDMNLISDEDETIPFETYIKDLNDLPDQLMTRKSIWLILQEGLSEIPNEQRSVFIKHEFENKSFKEISALTGLPVNTLISRKRYAILHLRKKLEIVYNELID